MHVVAGFESQITAKGAVLAVAGAARAAGVAVTGAALARRDSERGIHVDPLHGFEMPVHVLSVIETVIESEEPVSALQPGQTAFVVSSGSPASLLETVVDDAELDRRGALWVTLVPAR